MAEEWRLEKMSTSWIWDLKVVKVESPDYDNISSLSRCEATRRSPTRRSQLCFCQTDDWTAAGNGFFGTLISPKD